VEVFASVANSFLVMEGCSNVLDGVWGGLGGNFEMDWALLVGLCLEYHCPSFCSCALVTARFLGLFGDGKSVIFCFYWTRGSLRTL
jgi:hypothetical protein